MILDGKLISKKRKEQLKNEVIELIDKYHIVPKLAIIMVGNNPASEIYVRNKIKAASFCHMEAELVKLDESILMPELLAIIDRLNKDDTIHGIIAQLPLPKHLNEQLVIDSICEAKDIDGFGVRNKGRLFCGLPCLASATPSGIITLLEEYNINVSGMNAVVVGRSNIVGKPMAMLLLNKNATVTIAHSKTKDLKDVTSKADLLVVAIGKPKFITKDMVKPGAIVIDVGINRIEDHIYGDVDFDNVAPIVDYITPVPGGVGPLTIVTLLENTKKAYLNILNNKGA
ncbi:MAG: bifunctional 5,10-methylenetetrahydrofolate dehydrogenase/5,10-methenyltetrahydrofolate cyclohydrolase [Bacilli bacterium]